MAQKPKGQPPEGRGLSEAKGGDEQGTLGAFYDEYAARLYAYARSMGAAPTLAEDVVQEVFVKLARRLSVGGGVENPRAYLFGAARNEFYRWGTRILRRAEISASNAKGFLEAAAPGVPAEEAAAVVEALAALPRRQREAVVLKVYGGLTFAEIAEATGTGVNTAAGRYRAGVKKLRETLGEA